MLDMTVLISELLKFDRRKRKDPLADPLEGAEWQGMLWTLRLYDNTRGEGRGQVEKPDRSTGSVDQRRAQCSVAR
ncbi:hypothetical protein [Mesorhizobium sp. ZC-5]|uniref:hypothetical protein n=1 Tax=Mesorhizobium sp. ZC-5 TaxID=2986066 RepID=UPI0021E86825|nr:hypothetical protein [Mesorhizobium sp. ZC-5]MCV3243244.1 hypothetical protein [Mesorhizobium sp. ZC-5]